MTEPEFDDDERGQWEALAAYEDLVCPRCGNLRSVCSVRDGDWFPQRDVCWATATLENVDRRWLRKHRDAKPDGAGFLPTDGVRLWVSSSDLTPGDEFI